MAVNSTNNTSSTSSYSYLQYKNKIGGLVSGMDIDSLMEKLMKAESSQMEKLQQQKQKYEWQRDAYRDVNLKLNTFKNDTFDKFSYLSSWNAKTANSTSSKVSVTANSTANGTLNISAATKATAATSLVGTAQPGAIAESTEVPQGTTTLGSLGITGAGSFTLRALQNDGTMKDTVIKYEDTDSLSTLMSRISGSGSGVTALFNNGKMSISASNTGAAANDKAEVSLLNENEQIVNLFSKFGSSTTANSDGEIALADGGINASLTVNGIDYTNSSNKFSVSGYTIQVNSNISADDNVSVSSETNVQNSVDKVTEFVSMYNTLIESLNNKTAEKKNMSYSPLTDAQKSEMTKDEIENWETKAKAGLLRNDSTINSLLSNMRTILNGGSGSDRLSAIGITTSSTWSENGKLVIDEAKLRATIEKDPEALSRIFVGTDDNVGMISQLRKSVTASITNIESTAGKTTSVDNQYSLGRTLISIDDKISDWKDRLKGIEERYWKQFSAMETAIQKANNQSSIFNAG